LTPSSSQRISRPHHPTQDRQIAWPAEEAQQARDGVEQLSGRPVDGKRGDGRSAAARARRGRVHVFNPQASAASPLPSAGRRMRGPATAIRRADAFAFAVSQKGVEDGTFWSAKASDYLRGYFHAAALTGTGLRTVAAWDIRP
jgi:hypothetical protein